MQEPWAAAPPSPGPDLDDAWRYVWSEAGAPSRAWLKSMQPTALQDDTIIVSVPNEFTRSRVESRLREWVESELTSYFGRPIGIALVVVPAGGGPPTTTWTTSHRSCRR